LRFQLGEPSVILAFSTANEPALSKPSAPATDLILSKRPQQNLQVSGLLVTEFYGDGDRLAFNFDLENHLDVSPRIPSVEMFYGWENVWLSVEMFYGWENVWLSSVNFHCHGCASVCWPAGSLAALVYQGAALSVIESI
jgi:hypothetical protein